MPIKQFRGLASKGILKDPSPYDLDANAWSGGSNVRFASTKAMRSPVFRGVIDPLPASPAFVVGQPSSTGFDSVVFAADDGRLWTYFSGTLTETTPAGFVAAPVSWQFTADFLGDVLYVNNPNQGLYYVGPLGGAFARDPQWDTTWSSRVFRVFKDYPIALNVTKGAQNYPTLVKWGDTTLAGLTTRTWDATDPTSNAGETPIADLTGPILDGRPLRDVFVIYSQDQVWEMSESLDVEVFRFRQLFSEGGIIGTNCVCEVAGRHYVFGPNDIYTHDGITKTSILDKRNREWVYRNINMKQAGRCFVQHMPLYHEILFAYVSSDEDVSFGSPANGCNRGLIYNYYDDVMSFVDLPNVTSAGLANLNSVLTWATAPTGLTWANVGGSWADQDDSYGRVMVAVSATQSPGITADRLLAYDMMNKGSLAFPFVAELNPPAFLERIGLDLDEDGAGLSTYKAFNRVFPQCFIYDNVPVTIQIGASATPAGPVKWMPEVSFDPTTDYKVDVRGGGRYLAYRISSSQAADFEVTGIDAEIVSRGNR